MSLVQAAQGRIRGYLILLAMGTGVTSPTPVVSQTWSPEQEAVWATMQELWRYSTDLDLAAWFERVSEDYRGWTMGDAATRGKASWQEQAQARFSAPKRIHYQLNPIAIDIFGDIAVTFYHYAAVTRSEDGALSTSRGQWTDVLRREGSRWRLLADAGGETRSNPEMLVSAEWLEARLGEPGLVLLQIENSAEAYTEGHIPGARFLPYDRIVWDGANGEGAEVRPLEEIEAALERLGVDDGDHIVVYSSHSLRGPRLWLTLDHMGVGSRVSLLDGGLPAWTSEERPLSTDLPDNPEPGALVVRPQGELVVDADWILANLDDPALALVDARGPGEYTGEGQEAERVGHLPGAGNAPWTDLVESPQLFRLKDVAALAAVFQGAGADPGETVVPYCVVGLRASMDYFVARLLGYEARLYDGSWRDWTNRGHPLVTGSSGR